MPRLPVMTINPATARGPLRSVTLAVGASFLCVASITPANAAPASGLEQLGRTLADDELADMRGKFITPESISYFGIQMTSSWQGTDGITTVANLLFSVSFAGGAGSSGVPQMAISWQRDGDPSMDVSGFSDAASGGYVALVGDNVVVPVSTLGGVNGVVQSNVIGGADNNVRNMMSIAVVPTSSIVNGSVGDLHSVDGSTSQGFADGDSIQFSFGAGGVGISMTSGQGPDNVRQSIDSDFGRVAQQVFLSSNANQILNSTSIMIGTDMLQQIDSFRVQEAMSAVREFGY